MWVMGSVWANRVCYLKNMKHNDFNNTMTPISKAGATLCLRYQRPKGKATVQTAAAVTGGLPVYDCVPVGDTDTVEDEYHSAGAASAGDCCQRCQSDTMCTHAVFSDGVCYLKNLHHNDGGDRMSPIRAPGKTMCLKRYKTTAARIGPSSNVTSSTRSNGSSSKSMLLRLRLTALDVVIEDNWYWLPPKEDQFVLGGCFTGCEIDKFAHMKDLNSMSPSPPLTVALGEPDETAEGFVTRSVKLIVGAAARGSWLAFFVRLRALDAAGNDVLPATFSDNFISQVAGESVTVTLEHESGMHVVRVVAEPFNAVKSQ
jgi:hypothetical protein